MEQKRMNERFKIPPNHVGCARLGIRGRNRFEMSSGCGECTQGKEKRVMFCDSKG